MDFKIIFTVAAFTLYGCSSNKPIAENKSGEYYFKNYAMSTCISDGYQSQEVVSDAAAAARGYLEFGNLPLEAHTEATLLGRDFLKKEYHSKSGASLILMKCLDFYHSEELDLIFKSYNQCLINGCN